MKYGLKKQKLEHNWEKKSGTLLHQMQMSAALLIKKPIHVPHSTSRPKASLVLCSSYTFSHNRNRVNILGNSIFKGLWKTRRHCRWQSAAVHSFNFTIASDLPRLGYLTFLDWIMFFTFILTALMFIYNIALKLLESRDKKEMAEHIDRIMIWLYPSLYFTASYLVPLFFYKHSEYSSS